MTEQTPPIYTALSLPDRADYTDEQMQAEAEQFYAHLKTRHSIRAYSDRPVPKEVIEACVRAAGTAPSGANQQPWHFVAISDPAMKSRIRAAAEEEERSFMPVAAVMLGSKHSSRLARMPQNPISILPLG